MKPIIAFLIWLLPSALMAQQKKMLTFSFSLPNAATVSAGVYRGNVLIRTLFSNKHYTPGKHDESLEALDDDMQPITSTDGLTVKVLSNNVKYEWEGVIGNTSDSMTGNSVYHNFGAIKSMAFAGNFGYYTVGYNERKPSYGKFNIATPNQRIIITDKHIQADYAATDGKLVYWACSDPYAKGISLLFATKVSDDSEADFSNSQSYKTKTLSSSFEKTIAHAEDEKSVISGLAVQKKGRLLFIARRAQQRIDVLDKNSGTPLFSMAVESPGALATDGNNNLWVVTNNVVSEYVVNDEGKYDLVKTIEGFSKADAIAASPDNKTLLATDVGVCQLKAFSVTSGNLLWTFGQEGGYEKNGPSVTTDKFYFKDAKKTLRTFLAYQADGTFWVSDPGNSRVLHYTSEHSYINSIAYRSISYSTFTDLNNPTRVFSDYCEYLVDYSKQLAPNNGSWKLVKNWAAGIPEGLNDKYGKLRNVMTLKNGKTYALINSEKKSTIQVVELPQKGNIRLAGIVQGKYDLYADGSLRKGPGNTIGKPMVWLKRELTGFSSEGNPIWGEEKVIASSPPLTPKDPAPRNIRSAAEITSSGVLIAYEGATPSNGEKKSKHDRSFEYHLGGIKINDDGKWLWRTARATTAKYSGDFPRDGYFDIGNGVVRTGDVKHHAIGRNIFYGQHGEFWKGSQVNIWNHYYDDGLLVGNFGATGPEASPREAPYGMAGNIFTGSVVDVNGNLYLTHNDEGRHSGVHVWKISNLASIKEQTIPVALTTIAAKNSQLNLMDGLPYNKSLVNGDGGWQRNPASDDLSDKLKSYWQVHTNIKSYDRFEDPDIYVKFRSASRSSATLSKSLGSNNTSQWSLGGELNYDNNYASFDINKQDENGTGGQFLEILDDKGKIIFRFFLQLNYETKLMQLICNGVVIAQGDQKAMEKITRKFQPFIIKVSNGNLSFRYASFEEKIIPLMDNAADYKAPATVRLYFWTRNKNADRVISIKHFVFSKK